MEEPLLLHLDKVRSGTTFCEKCSIPNGVLKNYNLAWVDFKEWLAPPLRK
ncbi:hypothetical protein [Thermococcus sp.]|nr:hypothetical protein [Thermococcus sp.]